MTVENGILSFVLSGESAMLGWGNVGGKRDDFKLDAFPEQIVEKDKFSVELAMEQPTNCHWSVVYRDVRRIIYNQLYRGSHGVITGAFEQGGTMRFLNIPAVPYARGWARGELTSALRGSGWLEFNIKGQPGTRVQIKSVTVTKPEIPLPLFARYEFELPEGRVWRAVADVRGTRAATFQHAHRVRLHVNGHVLDMHDPQIFGWSTSARDIAPWLTPGRNVVGIEVERPYVDYGPCLYFQSRIVMESGATFDVVSGPDWKYRIAERVEAVWSRKVYDASDWDVVSSRMRAMKPDDVAPSQRGYDFWLPAYQGRLMLVNPLGRELVFSDRTNVLIEVYIPCGMVEIVPRIAYKCGSYAQGRTQELLAGTVVDARRDGNSLVFSLDFGVLSGGIYVIALALLDQDGKMLETRAREPLIVVATDGGKVVRGESYTEGLDLELEDEIDCADLRDPHPTFETCPVEGVIETPVIVEKPGLRYREVVGWRREAGFSYRIEFKHPGSFYLIEVDYPDDAKRLIEVIINAKRRGIWNNVQSSSGVETGGRHLPTGKMETLRWLHVADPCVHSIDVVNHHANEKGAVGRIRILRVKSRLPSLAMGKLRPFGHYTERTAYHSGIANVFGVGRIGVNDNPDYRAVYGQEAPMQTHIRHLEWLNDTYNRYVQWMKFSGRNLHIMGCFQYNAANTPFLRAPAYKTARIGQCMRRLLAHFMNANDIDFFTEVEWADGSLLPPLNARNNVSNRDVADGADTVRMINRDGNQIVFFNWLHPDVQSAYLKLMEDLMDAFGDLQSYKGIHAILDPQGVLFGMPGFVNYETDQLNALYASYDDVTFAHFEQDAGVKTGIDPRTPERFRARAKLIAEDSIWRGKFIAWRGNKMAEFFAAVAALVSRQRPELSVALLPWTSTYSVDNRVPQFFEVLERVQPAIDFEKYFKNCGINIEKLNAVPGVFVGRWATAWLRTRQNKYNSTQDPYLWMGQTAPKYTDLFNRYATARRYILLYADWNESWFNGPAGEKTYTTEPVSNSDWMVTRQLVRCHSQFGGFNAREPITQALIVSDPNMLVHGFADLAFPVGHEQELRSIARVISSLPAENFTPALATGRNSNWVIRQLRQDDKFWFYVANPCQWPVMGTLSISNNGALFVVPDHRRIGAGAMNLDLELEPFGVQAFCTDSAAASLIAYQTKPPTPEWLERIKAVIKGMRDFVDLNAEKYMLTDVEQRALEKQLQCIESKLADGEYAAAWDELMLPEVWKYNVYDPSVEERYFGADLRRRRIEQLRRELTGKKAGLPPGFLKENPAPFDALRELRVERMRVPINIDGKLEEVGWQSRACSSDFRCWVEQTNAFVETGVLAQYDDEALCLAFVCADPDISGLEANARGEREVFHDDSLGFFLYPGIDGIYYQFGFNAKRIRFDQQVVGGNKLYEQYKPSWRVAVQTQPGFWTAEIRMPWQAIGLKGPPEKMNANFFRVFRYQAVDGGFWSATQNGHDVSRTGVLIFEK